MNNVKVLVNTGSDDYAYRFSRVPIAGEHVRLKGQTYKVESVIHTPNNVDVDAYAAEITVTLIRPT
jgi:hypothetical protein